MTAPNEATLLQNLAADPAGSTWLSANAGSGKTRVLTDRVARLLLSGADPQGILCLTYTKAAASEMQNRLFKRLGEWAMLDNRDLIRQLRDLGEEGSPDLNAARTLFARAIETPGGLRIQTIHSFCASILRRFPLEAGVSPAFTEMDDSAQHHLIAEVLDDMADAGGEAGEALAALASQYTGNELEKLVADIVAKRDAVPGAADFGAVLAEFGLPPDADDDLPLKTLFRGVSQAFLDDCAARVRVDRTMNKVADAFGRVNAETPSSTDFDTLCGALLITDRTRANSRIPTKPAREALGALLPDFEALIDAAEQAAETLRALTAARQTHVLRRFARTVLSAYDAEKARRGWLDFDDLIRRTEALLTDPDRAAWVLYKLDGGIRHVLIDEAQDTSPAQWRVIDLLTQEFGQSETEGRTLFVVGDKKQSIYSFQGADPQEFDRRHEMFRVRLEATTGLMRRMLQHSFRSSRAVLTAVDRTFAMDVRGALGESPEHRAFHSKMPGRVDLWPLVPKPEKEEDGDWTDPVDKVSANHEAVQLSGQIADEIARMIAEETIPCDKAEKRRPITAGDILILVQRRSGDGGLFHELIRACKAKGLPVAGADRLRIGGELAVRDLRALLSFLALPEDDLSLAATLRSPLFGITEDMLFRLAYGRGRVPLWAVLRDRADDFPEAMAILDDLRGAVDFLRPFDLLERILTRHGGRARLIARLGTEAEDGIDELLNQALSYERQAVPSLTGFLAWIESEDIEIKRQMDSAGGRIRVMTVHGAKGLESPVVILPDTLRARRGQRGNLAVGASGRLLWSGASAEVPAPVREASAAASDAEARERERLLYVAMTRAESWLIVAGAGTRPKEPTSWYDAVDAGLQALGAGPVATPTGEGLRFETGDWAGLPLKDDREAEPDRPALPAWARTPPPPELPDDTALSPSDLGGAKVLPGDPGLADEGGSLRRGTLIHLLLEHLPGVAPTDRAAAAGQLFAQSPDPVSDTEAAEILAEAAAVLDHPGLAPVFAPDALAEVGVTARLDALGGRRIAGTIDRLIVTDTEILIVDYKSNALIPDRPEGTPEGLLRQLGAYVAAVSAIYPGRPVASAILWTRAAQLMRCDNKIVMEALQRSGTS